MKLLYISCFHPTLEYDDLNLLTELGIDWFSAGLYRNPKTPLSPVLRPPINKEVDPKILQLFLKDNLSATSKNCTFRLSREFLDNFDGVFIANSLQSLSNYVQSFKDKLVIYRTHDEHTIETEAFLKLVTSKFSNVKVVRMFHWENNISFAGTFPTILSSYVDPEVYKGWTGTDPTMLTFQNDFRARANHVDINGIRVYKNYSLYPDIIAQVPSRLHGVSNGTTFCRGPVDWETQKALYQSHRVYLSLGSKPSWFTYNLMEAMMTGMPVINFGKEMGSYLHSDFKDSYLLPDLITNGVNGFCLDSLPEIIDTAKELLNNHRLAAQISTGSREFALKHFSKETQLTNWRTFLNNV